MQSSTNTSEMDGLTEGSSFSTALEWETLGLNYYLGTNEKPKDLILT